MAQKPIPPSATQPSAADLRGELVQELTADELFSFAAHVACLTPALFDATISALLVLEVAGR